MILEIWAKYAWPIIAAVNLAVIALCKNKNPSSLGIVGPLFIVLAGGLIWLNEHHHSHYDYVRDLLNVLAWVAMFYVGFFLL